MPWFNTDGYEDIRVLWTRFRFYRNIAGNFFDGKTGKSTNIKSTADIDTLLEKNGFHKTDIQNKKDAIALLEKQCISEEIINCNQKSALYFNDPCSLSISYGGKDTFIVQSLLCGLCPDECYKIASEAESMLDSKFEFAYSEKFGYLSPVPGHVGCGTEISCALFLPCLNKKKKIDSLKSLAFRSSFELYPMFTYDNNPSDIYILNYLPQINIGESCAVAYFFNIAKYIVAYEKECEQALYLDSAEIIHEKYQRALGIMEYAGKVDECEFLSLHSALRLYAAMTDNSTPIKELNSLLSCCLSASVAGTDVKADESIQNSPDNFAITNQGFFDYCEDSGRYNKIRANILHEALKSGKIKDAFSKKLTSSF